MLKSVYKLYKTKRNEKGQESVGIYLVTMTQISKYNVFINLKEDNNVQKIEY
jgi:hypothetical protein